MKNEILWGCILNEIMCTNAKLIRQVSGSTYLELICDLVVNGKFDEMYTRCRQAVSHNSLKLPLLHNPPTLFTQEHTCISGKVPKRLIQLDACPCSSIEWQIQVLSWKACAAFFSQLY